jgi:hypothetical protein
VDKRGIRLTGNLGVKVNKSDEILIIVNKNRVFVLAERI